MTTILTKKNSTSYAIYVDGNKIVECNDPLTSYNELVKNIGIDITNVEIHETESFPPIIIPGNGTILGSIIAETIAEREVIMGGPGSSIHDAKDYFTDGVKVDLHKTNTLNDFDAILAKVNSETTAKNLGKYHGRTDVDEKMQKLTDTSNIKNETPTSKNVPVGSVEKPELGDLIYVDGINGFLRKVTGGIGTVHMVYESNETITTNEDISRNNIQDFEEDDEEYEFDETSEKNLIVELEEIPGVYFSWSLLRSKQSELQEKYGYKPACAL